MLIPYLFPWFSLFQNIIFLLAFCILLHYRTYWFFCVLTTYWIPLHIHASHFILDSFLPAVCYILQYEAILGQRSILLHSQITEQLIGTCFLISSTSHHWPCTSYTERKKEKKKDNLDLLAYVTFVLLFHNRISRPWFTSLSLFTTVNLTSHLVHGQKRQSPSGRY